MVDELGWWSSSSPCSALHIEVTEHHLDARDHLEDYLVTRRVHIVHLHVRCGVSEHGRLYYYYMYVQCTVMYKQANLQYSLLSLPS